MKSAKQAGVDPGRRQIWLINPRFQIRFLAYLSMVSAVTIAVFYGANVYFFSALQRTGVGLGLPSDHLFFEFVKAQAHTMNLIFLVTALLVMLLICVSGLYLSHRVAGPLYRLNKHMQAVADGKTLADVSFRKKDFFPEVAENYNRQLSFLTQRKKTD